MAATPVVASGLTPRQEERRQRVIRAALQLGAEGGYDAVQMREVSATASVALGTIYRYFSSKDHLLAAAMAEWTAELQERMARTPPRDETAADRAVELLRRAWRAMEKSPKLSAALVRALASEDEGVAACANEVTDRFADMTRSVIGPMPADVQDGIIAVLGHVWHSALVSWVNGRMTFDEVGAELERAARLLLDPQP
jgi:AcrR family transcriptional regulator